MSGSCALNSWALALFIGLFLGSTGAWANYQKGTIFSSEALIYTEPHYNAEILTTLKQGEVFFISKKMRGPFYRIRVKKGVMAWISKEDIRVGELSLDKIEEEKKRPPENTPFFALRHWGLAIDYIYYTENTMGSQQQAWTPFVGVKWTGFETLFSGPLYIESHLLVSAPPSYYNDRPGVSASGAILIGDFLLQAVNPRGKRFLTYYGAGPLLKYSHLNLEAGSEKHLAQELGLGLVVNLGAAFQLNSTWSLRLDGKYYWERERYYGVGFSLGRIF